ncbi:MAG: 2-oxoacid:acceptor oxidoreductase subunit alpha [Patescibacteria group bacterium]
MSKDPHSGIFTVGIGGAAGDGVREAGQSLGALLCDLGYEVFISFNYPSLIRGGHNFSRISFSEGKVWCDHERLDVLIALNEEAIQIHKNELNKNAVIFADSFEPDDIKEFGANAVIVPMLESSKELGAPPITRNSVALGATCYLLGLHFPQMQKVLQEVFKEKRLEANIKLADIGYEHLKKMNFRHSKSSAPSLGREQSSNEADTSRRGLAARGDSPRREVVGEVSETVPMRSDGGLSKEVVDGNVAFGKGLEAAGLDFYIGYPMTPATGILHYLAGNQNKSGVKVIQPESELSVINMALGIAYAGKRVAIGSATGGFALMQEAFSFASMAELPLVIAVSQRQAPATGVPTYSSQSDLQMVIHSGHGEFPRIVIAPGDAEEAFLAGANALDLAWKYQLPVIVLLDKILSEHSATSLLDSKNIKIEHGKVSDNMDGNYGRYEITPDGISPMAFPGTSNTGVKITGYEHDSSGITADEADSVKAMIDKRFAKTETLFKELSNRETVKVYGDTNSKNIIVFWGSTKGPVMEVAKYLNKPVKLAQILWVEPFDIEKVMRELKGAEKIINIECNHNGQMAALIREKTGIEVTDNILKYDSRPFEVAELLKQINEKLN